MNSRLSLLLPMCLFVFASAAGAADQRSWTLAIFGGVNRHASYGSASDYIPGENDFPVTPAHSPATMGFAIGRAAGAVEFEIDFRWTFPARILLADPSDGDTVSLKTSPHASLALNVVFCPFGGVLRPFAEAGGGMDVVFAGNAAYTTAHGYIIEVPAPATADRFDPEAHAGGGFLVFVRPSLGFRGEVRAVWVFDKPKTVRSFQVMGGLFVRF